MPNWNYNSVEIHAPLDAVKAWFIPQSAKTDDSQMTGHYLFNMHKLFSENVPVTDPT